MLNYNFLANDFVVHVYKELTEMFTKLINLIKITLVNKLTKYIKITQIP